MHTIFWSDSTEPWRHRANFMENFRMSMTTFERLMTRLLHWGSNLIHINCSKWSAFRVSRKELNMSEILLKIMYSLNVLLMLLLSTLMANTSTLLMPRTMFLRSTNSLKTSWSRHDCLADWPKTALNTTPFLQTIKFCSESFLQNRTK